MTEAERYEEIEKAQEQDLTGWVCLLCEAYLRDYPERGSTCLIFAQNLIPLGRYAEADAVLRKAEEVTPPKWRHLVLAERGFLAKARGDFGGAEEIFMATHRMAPDDATYLIYVAGVVARQGDLERAVELSTQATRCSKGCIDEAYYNLGGQLLGLKRYEEALSAYQKAIEIDPHYKAAHLRVKDVEKILNAIEEEGR